MEESKNTTLEKAPNLSPEMEEWHHQYLYDFDLARGILKSFHTLTDRERKLLQIRYGMAGEEPKTLAETGRQLGISRERVGQLEYRAVWRLICRSHEKNESV